MNYHLYEINDKIKNKVVDFIIQHWGSPKIVSRGKVHSMAQLPGIVVLRDNNIIGLLTYSIENEGCEIVSLDSLVENKGLGTTLMNEIEKIARAKKCHRIWLITTNDNIRALKFYQKRGYDIKAIHRHAVENARKIKPEIPLKGYDDIPINHEIELEKWISI